MEQVLLLDPSIVLIVFNYNRTSIGVFVHHVRLDDQRSETLLQVVIAVVPNRPVCISSVLTTTSLTYVVQVSER